MLKLSGNRIKMTQGDSVQIEISLTDGNGKPYEPHDGRRWVSDTDGNVWEPPQQWTEV